MYYIYFVYRNIVDLNVGQQSFHRRQTIGENEWARESRRQRLPRRQLDLVQWRLNHWDLNRYVFCKKQNEHQKIHEKTNQNARCVSFTSNGVSKGFVSQTKWKKPN